MKALVTGGGGFLGRHIISQLLEAGREVRLLGRSSYPDLKARGVECIQADLADHKAVLHACDSITTVFHVASLAGVWGGRALYHQTNVVGTENVIAGCVKAEVSKLVYTSTPSVVYGKNPIIAGDETLPYQQKYLTHYAATKAEAEQLVIAADSNSLHTCALRPHLIWGPGDTNLIPRLVARAKAGRIMQVGDGSNMISVSFVENIAAAHLVAEERLEKGSPVCGESYFVNQTEPVNCWEFISRLLRTLDAPPVKRKVSLSTAYAVGAAMEVIFKLAGFKTEPPMTRFLALQLGTSHWFKTDKARNDLGWEPRVGIDEGMSKLINSSSASAPPAASLSAPGHS